MENHSKNDAQHWIRQAIRDLSAYHVADASGMIKLDAMENPYVWPDELRQQWKELLVHTDVNRYPDPSGHQLKQQLRQAMNIPADMGILLGNGSDEIIQIIAMALSGTGRSLLSVDPGFVMYKMIASFCGLKYIGVPLRQEDFSLDLPAILQAMDQHQPAVIFLAYPNNPTGNLFDEQQVIKIIEAAPGLVVIDEAYAPFTDKTFMNRLGQYDNLVVMRTVSKMGLAGLRLGYLAGPRDWLNEFEKLRLPYNINTLTQLSAELAMKNHKIFDDQTTRIKQQRTLVNTRLAQMDALEVYPSDANFILIKTVSGQATRIHKELKEKGILIKLLDGASPMLKGCLRITIGTEEENQLLLSSLAKIL
ncbi:MAG: histidinol-phosphate transaminase [Gammaproteobacteria bacterium]|nr:histidinol-phosphate transaminase [Gammaproteobacteria bacterium]